MELISNYDKIIARLKAEGRITQIIWTPEQQADWNKQMDEIRRDYRHKALMSEISASKVYFTA